MLDVKRLRVLREVAEQGSFSGAAEALSYTQSAVSQQIAALERETGTTLVERGARGIRLTDAGRALVEHAEAILARLAAAEAELEAIAGLRGGRLRLASFPSAGASLLPRAIAEFTRRHPAVELSLIESEPEESVPLLKSGELDIALVFEYAQLPHPDFDTLYDGIELIHLLDDPMYLTLARDHPLAARKRLRLEDLAGEAWIQNDCSGPCGRMHLAACHAAGFEPRVEFQSDDYNVVQGLVAAGVGISLVPELALSAVRDDVVVREIGAQGPLRRILAATSKSGFRPPATGAMLEVLSEVSEGYRGGRPSLAAAS
jgi:DNA-binding transcriptional LysR family regulator